MGEKKYIKNEEFNQIIAGAFLYGKSNAELAAQIGCGLNTICSSKQAFKALRDGDYDGLIQSIGCSNNVSDRIIEMAAEALSIEIPAPVSAAMKKRYDDRVAKEEAKKKLPVIKVPEGNPLHVPAPEPVQQQPEQHNEQVYFCRLLEELHKHNELMEQLMDVVLPKYASDLKDNLNVNFDAVTQSLKRCEDMLEGVKINTRKRGL